MIFTFTGIKRYYINYKKKKQILPATERFSINDRSDSSFKSQQKNSEEQEYWRFLPMI